MGDDTSADEFGTEDSTRSVGGSGGPGDGPGGGDHPSQAEGEDPDDPPVRPDPDTDGHPSQAEGEDAGESGRWPPSR